MNTLHILSKLSAEPILYRKATMETVVYSTNTFLDKTHSLCLFVTISSPGNHTYVHMLQMRANTKPQSVGLSM
jgi:hypothetical protein